ncbi:MAG: hypothetical protein ACBR12_05575 [Microcoleus sp.]
MINIIISKPQKINPCRFNKRLPFCIIFYSTIYKMTVTINLSVLT